jgi:thiosulfate/3-mercaptopyruvate sulfurtransferase
MQFRTMPKATLPGFPMVAATNLALLLIMALLLLTPNAVPQILQPQAELRTPQVREQMLVSTEWLAHHLNDPGVVILHVARERSDYDAGHISGARFLAVGQIAVTRDHLSNELAPVADLKTVFESLGVGDGTRVVLYGEQRGLWAARAWFTLDYLGHGDNAALLDGNQEKWRAENRLLTKDVPQIKPALFTPRVHPHVLVTLPVVSDLSWEALNTALPGAVLVDARPSEDYLGERPAQGVPRPGHIPGAINLPWTKTQESTNNPQLLPQPKLHQLFQSAGVAPERKVVTYCGSGIFAAYVYFTAKYLGYDVALYDGSFQEWSNTQGTPVATKK